ncbi:NADPH-dependent alcohol dehydrogenase [Lyophyllum atratum]|nr:NADPH-dependent alcohol dehydrogenase [Lyophyllum atratum]
MSSQTEIEWKGYAVHDIKQHDKFEVINFKPKKPDDYDIDVKIAYCGICGSDIHTITGGWGQPILPLIPGHEIVGHVVRVGPKVTEFKVGDRAGVGAQVCSCFKCKPCNTDNEQYCITGRVDTYNAKYPNGDIAQGGYSTAIRAHERFVFPLPKDMPLEQIAPMMCAGLTVYSPLVRNGAGPGVIVGVMGVGGLGHLAIQFARALGADKVVVLSRSANKEKDARELGATDFVTTGTQGFAKQWEGKIDLIICTATVSRGIPLAELIQTLAAHGRLMMVSLPDEDLPPLKSSQLAPNGAYIGGSHIGSKKEAIEMLDLASKKGVKPWVEVVPMKDCGQAVRNFEKGLARYRYVLKADL